MASVKWVTSTVHVYYAEWFWNQQMTIIVLSNWQFLQDFNFLFNMCQRALHIYFSFARLRPTSRKIFCAIHVKFSCDWAKLFHAYFGDTYPRIECANKVDDTFHLSYNWLKEGFWLWHNVQKSLSWISSQSAFKSVIIVIIRVVLEGLISLWDPSKLWEKWWV